METTRMRNYQNACFSDIQQMCCEGKCFTYPRIVSKETLLQRVFTAFSSDKRLSSTTVDRPNSNFNNAHGIVMKSLLLRGVLGNKCAGHHNLKVPSGQIGSA